jgi:diguanylate cyclase (GGDEF)-like protein
MTSREPFPTPLKANVFGEIAELAAQLCGAGCAAITLFDGTHHRPVASVGKVQLAELPRDTRLCDEVLHLGVPLEVTDARFDERYQKDPLVVSPPRVRFFSGVPLLGESGDPVGTLSVLDVRAKVLAVNQRIALWKLADVVARLVADIAARKTAEQHLSWRATHDGLTDLANRDQFEVALARGLESARRRNECHAILYIDLDQFKVVNDTCGHMAGDALLRQLAQALTVTMRRGDTLARLGGDEFGVLLEGCDKPHAQAIAAKILSVIRAFRFAWEGRVFTLGASIGVAAMTDESRDSDSVLAAADTACYVAKDKGRNQVQAYCEDDEEVSSRHCEMNWVSSVTQAAEKDRFFLEAQRVVALNADAGAATEYLELLLRMRDPEGRVVPPMAFIPAAERYHLMGTIDRWVVGKALRCLASLGRQIPAHDLPRLGINLSGMSLGDPAFADHVLEQFELTHTSPGFVCFEITETAAISNLARAARFIRIFRDLGCRFALDDFGAGLSSFAYLKNLEVDYIKIDGAFVRGIESDRIDRAAVAAIQQLSEAAGAKTIAECVEDAGSLARVSSLDIDFGQGYMIHRPEPFCASMVMGGKCPGGSPRDIGCHTEVRGPAVPARA